MNNYLINGLNPIIDGKDRLYDYKNFCERIFLIKSSCKLPPPTQYPFLKYRMKKKQMEKDRQKEIQYGNDLIVKKLREMSNKPTKYNPLSMKFAKHPGSQRFSKTSNKQIEIDRSNQYLKDKIRKIKSGKGFYNTEDSMNRYIKLKKIENNICLNSRFRNFFIDVVTPHTYEKRIRNLFNEKDRKDVNMFNRTNYSGWNSNLKNNELGRNKKRNKSNNSKIEIEREFLPDISNNATNDFYNTNEEEKNYYSTNNYDKIKTKKELEEEEN